MSSSQIWLRDRHRRAPFFRRLALGLVLSGSCLLSGCVTNFHEVESGLFYRSGQLSNHQLEIAIEEHGIRTVINLRGSDPHDDWYRNEVEVCARMGVAHHDLSMSARRLPHKDDVLELLRLYDESDYPILVHCQGGSDRSGLASALWIMEILGKSKRHARDQLSARYFHFERLAPSQHRFLSLYRGEQWTLEEYDPCSQPRQYYPRRHCQ